MKKRLPALCLSLTLCLSLLPSALAAPEFTDVPAGSWFEEGAVTCAQKGVMVGTGEGLFSPDTELTAAECLTFALRLYDLQRGGDGKLETAPEDWGKLELALSDGTAFTRYGYNDPFFSAGWFQAPDGTNLFQLYVQAPGEATEERESWAKVHEGKATLTARGKEYSGTVMADSIYDGPCLRFSFDAPDDGGLDISDLVSTARPGPDKWFRDPVYTAETWALQDEPGFETPIRLCYGNAGEAGWCDRGIFAQALSVAAGELEKQYAVERIPDLERNESTAYIYTLYEAGILNGMDSTGVFNADKSLTRAEAAVMVARILDKGQRLTEAPAAPNAYDIAVAELRNGFTYYDKSERTYETEDCTVFVYDRGGAMHTGNGNITILYKPGSQPGAGAVVEGKALNFATYLSGPDRVDFNAEANTLTYAYRVEEDIIGAEGYPSYPAGIHTFTVDLPTGETAQSYAPLSLEGSAEVLAKGRSYTLERRLDGENCAVILRWKELTWTDDTRDYELWLVQGDGSIQKLLLPSTALRYDGYYKPTDRAPDSLEMSADGRTLTYTYRFDEALINGDNVLHEAGTYTYTVDTATGELSVSHTAN